MGLKPTSARTTPDAGGEVEEAVEAAKPATPPAPVSALVTRGSPRPKPVARDSSPRQNTAIALATGDTDNEDDDVMEESLHYDDDEFDDDDDDDDDE